MAHELTMNGEFAEMAYIGDTPWHGLGQRLEVGASIDTWAMAAGMNWSIRRANVQYKAGRSADAPVLQVPDQQVLYRGDSGISLGIVSPKYEIVQPREVLEFFRDLTAMAGFSLETAGTLFGGKKFWALAKVESAIFCGWDKVDGYVLLTSSADGSSSTEARETTVRVVCNNTLSMATSEKAKAGGIVKVPHRVSFDADAVKSKLGATADHFAAFTEAANLLTQKRVSAAKAESFVELLLSKSSTEEESSCRRPKGLDTVLSLFSGQGQGSTQKGSDGTMWGLVNSVTEYVDHYTASKTASHRFLKSLTGTGADLKSEAFALALDF